VKPRNIAALFLLLNGALWAQSPTPQQVQQAADAVQSGQVQVTPDLINKAKAQYPDLQNVPNEEIQKKADEMKNSGAATDESKPAADAPDAQWVSIKAGGGFGGGANAFFNQRFPTNLRRFGQDFFQNTDLGGLGANAPALPDYMISPGDEIQVYTWGRESSNQTVVIDNEGMFNYPPLSPLRISGMKFSDAQKLIASEIEKIQGVTASVGLGKLKSIRIMVLGEAVRPGSFTLPAGITVTSALFRSGGITDIGSLRNIQVRRDDHVIATLDLYDMLLKGNSHNDIQLLPGDVVFIPIATTQIAVEGMVKRPAIYEVKPGVKVLEALDLAGGLFSSAFQGRVRLDRVQNHKRNVVLDVDMEGKSALSNVTVEDGDILYVDKVLDKVDDAVFLQGNVNRPGRYQYKTGMTVKDLIPSLQDLLPETFFGYAHILRPSLEDEHATVISFSLNDVFNGTNIPLQPRDTVEIYNQYQVQERPVVKAAGMVRRPGSYPYQGAMTVSDLVLAAGGLGDAYLPEADLIRPVYEAENDSISIKLIKVNLKNVLDNPGGEDNLKLRPFDSLIVFPRSSFILPKSVSIYGAVNKEGTYELAENMGVPELIDLAGGLTKNSFRLNIEIVRRIVVNDSVLTRNVQKMNLQDLLDGQTSFTLQDGDGVYIREVVNAHQFTTISLSGEFNFPGRYEFQPGEKLSSVIRRAGGFTSQAYLPGTIFIRQSVKAQQLEHAQEASRRLQEQLQGKLQQTTDENEKAEISADMERQKELVGEIERAPYLGRVVIKLDRDLKFAGTDWDVVLEDGDNIYVGPRLNTVSILGEVYSPTTVIYTKKTNTIRKCLAIAGGVDVYGDYDNTFYIAPDGSVITPQTTGWFESYGGVSVEPGGSIIVPTKPPVKDYLDEWVKLTQILYQTAIAVGVVKILF